MSFTLGNVQISNQLKNNFFSNAMDIISFLTDGIVFSTGKDIVNNQWKEQWIKYCRMIMPYSGYRIEYSHPYKSDKHKDITEYIIYKNDNDKLIDSNQSWCLENAEAQAYIIISQLSTFEDLYRNKVENVKWIIDKIPTFRLNIDVHHRNYRVGRDLEKIINNKTLIREWKLSLLEI